MRYLYVLAVLFGIYMFTTDSGREVYQGLRSFFVAPIDKANAAAKDMSDRNDRLSEELDELEDEVEDEE